MNMIDPLLDEYKFETALTRKHLERVPDAHWDWKPHPKSMRLGQLASHLAEAQAWIAPTMAEDEFVIDMATYKPFLGKNAKEVLAEFDAKVKDAVAAMTGQPNENLVRTWTMKTPEGHVIIQMPRVAVIRTMFLNHMIHHRGQLTVYLRMKDVPVPSTYGPSADEGGM
jgi:uncharacterized damage-inducible protein DinB